MEGTWYQSTVAGQDRSATECWKSIRPRWSWDNTYPGQRLDDLLVSRSPIYHRSIGNTSNQRNFTLFHGDATKQGSPTLIGQYVEVSSLSTDQSWHFCMIFRRTSSYLRKLSRLSIGPISIIPNPMTPRVAISTFWGHASHGTLAWNSVGNFTNDTWHQKGCYLYLYIPVLLA
jgi:hypothetical protein